MSKYIYPEDGIKTVTEKQSSRTLTVTIRVDDQAIERLKQSCDLFMHAIGAKLLRWSGSSGIK